MALPLAVEVGEVEHADQQRFVVANASAKRVRRDATEPNRIAKLARRDREFVVEREVSREPPATAPGARMAAHGDKVIAMSPSVRQKKRSTVDLVAGLALARL